MCRYFRKDVVKEMKVALVHDYIKEYGGAERVLEALHELYPDAPVYTTVYLPQFLGPHKERFKDWKIHTSWLQYIPMKGKLISPLRILSPFVFGNFDFSKYDVIIVSATGAYFPNSLEKGKAVQICYCHTPPRYLYGYATAREWKKNVIVKAFATIANHLLRMVDYDASKNVDYYIANSEEVASRISKFYRRDAAVMYPPVDTKILSNKDIKKKSPNILISQYPNIKDYYLAGGRLARPKHIDIIVRACRELKVPLKVFGKGFAGYGDELKDLAYSSSEDLPAGGDESRSLNPDSSRRASLARTINNIQFLGEVSDEEKMDLMAGAKAFIFASEDEDFGIVPVEAMARGTPVIAYRSGGVKETVVDGKTGIFFEELKVNSLKEAIKRFEKTKLDPKDCINQAQKFSKERFMKEVKEFIRARVT